MFDDTYKEIESSTIAIYKEKGSKFIAYSFVINTEDDVKAELKKVKKLEYAARHYCFAYILNPNKSIQRTNDDGEPSSTAGKPILGQILSHDLTNILIIVVRYFGGVKLGIPGLIRSYKTATSDAISNATIITKTIKNYYEVIFKYHNINNVMKLVKKFNLDVISTDFKTESKLIFAVEISKASTIVKAFKKNYELTIRSKN